jgi:hypothetical protein
VALSAAKPTNKKIETPRRQGTKLKPEIRFPLGDLGVLVPWCFKNGF